MLKLRALFVQLPSLPEVLINQARVRPEFPMPLSPRSRFLLSLACLALGILPLQAQINGAAPSVTSMGFGGTFLNGIRPSVTSLGPITYGRTLPMGNCCANFFMPSTDDRGRGSGHHRRHHDGDSFPIGVFEPASIPYAVSEADDEDEEPETEPGLSSARVLNSKPGTRPSGYRDPAPVENNKVERTVDAQPSTVLIFKDGHRSDVVNYAIVGDTLFDFAPGRTRKILLSDLDLSATHQANDDRGIDFEVPETTVGQ
jgi:hypothetical protein